MTSSNLKCKGCGNILTTDKNSLGYVPKLENKPSLCQRCFQFKYYNKPYEDNLIKKQVQNKITNLVLTNYYVFLVCDVLFLKTTLIKLKDHSYKKLFIIVNKIDCLPKSFNTSITLDYITKTIEEFEYVNYEIFYTSINNNSSIKRLNKFISGLENNTKKIFIGKSNTGKTSLINALLKLNNSSTKLVSSYFLNTTLDFNKIKLNKTYIIDTPGFIDEDNLLNFINPKNVKKICDLIKSRNYYLSANQTLSIEQLCAISIDKAINKTNITFYLGQNLHIDKIKKENINKYFQNDKINRINYNIDKELKSITFDLDSNKKHNLIIHGLCLISVNAGVEQISIVVNEKVRVELVNYAII